MANRGANQSIENSQASHVRPRRRELLPARMMPRSSFMEQNCEANPITGDNNIFATDKALLFGVSNR